jgi:hypothetical protein
MVSDIIALRLGRSEKGVPAAMQISDRNRITEIEHDPASPSGAGVVKMGARENFATALNVHP